MSTWGTRGTLAAVGVAVAIAGVGAAAVYGATEPAPSMMMGGSDAGPPPDRSGRQTGAEPADAALHGEYVVADGPGGVITHLTQVGRLMALSPTSATVRSANDFTTTYVIPPGADAPRVRVGDEVDVRATRDGAAAVIQSIDRPPLATGY